MSPQPQDDKNPQSLRALVIAYAKTDGSDEYLEACPILESLIENQNNVNQIVQFLDEEDPELRTASVITLKLLLSQRSITLDNDVNLIPLFLTLLNDREYSVRIESSLAISTSFLAYGTEYVIGSYPEIIPALLDGITDEDDLFGRLSYITLKNCVTELHDFLPDLYLLLNNNELSVRVYAAALIYDLVPDNNDILPVLQEGIDQTEDTMLNVLANSVMSRINENR